MSSNNPLFSSRAELEQAERYRQSRNYSKARDICERLLKSYPDYYGALHTAGLIYADMGNFERSLTCLSKANAYCPGNLATLTALGTVYFELGSRDLAAQFVAEATKIDPSSPPVWQLLGEVRRDDREYELALEAFSKALELQPDWKEAKVGLAQTLSSLGRNLESARLLEDCLKEDDQDFSVIAALSALPQGVRTVGLRPLIKKMRGATSYTNFEETLGFINARLLHQEGNYDEAWKLLVTANTKIKRGLREKLSQTRDYEQATLQALASSEAKICSGDFSVASLFILGPSRSGKTTVESILSLCGDVKCGYENPIALNALRRTFRENGFISASQYAILPKELEAVCRNYYLSELSSRSKGKIVFTNTTPSRIHDLNRIFAIIPRVRVIFVKRNERDNVFNVFSTMYKTGNYYSYDIIEAFNHVRWYNKMIDLIAKKYPDNVKVIDYEEVVKNPLDRYLGS